MQHSVAALAQVWGFNQAAKGHIPFTGSHCRPEGLQGAAQCIVMLIGLRIHHCNRIS